MNSHVAIDGPVASGKTTVARLLAQRLRYLYLDTGAMYRAVAYLALQERVEVDNGPALARLCEDDSIRVALDSGAPLGYRIFALKTELQEQLFGNDVTAVVSTVAAHPAVRGALVQKQRAIAAQGPVVMAGRDIGTVVLPDARFKVYLTASVSARAERRRRELEASGAVVDEGRVRAAIEERDRLDASRTVAPLRPAPDARIVDSSETPAEDVVAALADWISRPEVRA